MPGPGPGCPSSCASPASFPQGRKERCRTFEFGGDEAGASVCAPRQRSRPQCRKVVGRQRSFRRQSARFADDGFRRSPFRSGMQERKRRNRPSVRSASFSSVSPALPASPYASAKSCGHPATLPAALPPVPDSSGDVDGHGAASFPPLASEKRTAVLSVLAANRGRTAAAKRHPRLAFRVCAGSFTLVRSRDRREAAATPFRAPAATGRPAAGRTACERAILEFFDCKSGVAKLGPAVPAERTLDAPAGNRLGQTRKFVKRCVPSAFAASSPRMRTVS